jgi:uncharacterized protein YjiK
MENRSLIRWLFLICACLMVISCDSQRQKFSSPPGYDFSKPKRYKMPMALKEISGITFNKGINDTLYAEEDENGKVFHFKLGDQDIQPTRFGKKGDFEDIAICNQYVILLRSDGVLFTFPLSETRQNEAQQVKSFEGLLAAGEYEGLASDEKSGKVFVLCKQCSNEKTRKTGGGTILQLDASGNLTASGEFAINVKEIDALAETRKINFHPSALARNPVTGEWWILSATNRMLVIADETWKINAAYKLDPTLFNQPEGMAFDSRRNLYISNERGQQSNATVLEFDSQNK